jgi:hypothetical protein
VYSQFATFAGKAADNQGIWFVNYQVASGPFPTAAAQVVATSGTAAFGTTNWSANVQLLPGNNLVRFRSVDFATNVSAPISRYVNYIVTNQLVLQTNGTGSVSPDLNGHWLSIGQIYSLTARPGPGQIFYGWSGPGVNASQPALNFIMRQGMSLTARFIPNPFKTKAGNYAGLFYNTNQPAYSNSGSISFQVGTLGAYSGRLFLAGASYGFSGHFDPNGNSTLPVVRPGRKPLVLALGLDLGAGENQISGYVTNYAGTNTLVAELQTARNVYDARTNAAPQAGAHAFSLQSTGNGVSQTVGSGIAQVTAGGEVVIRGMLTPGPSFAFNAFLQPGGVSPFYLPVSTGPGTILGWLELGDGSALPPPSMLYWLTTGANGAESLQVIFTGN